VYRGHPTLSAAAKDYKATAGWLALAQGVEVLNGAVGVSLTVYRKAKRGDADNFIKVCLDSLNGVAWEDDKQIVEIHLYRRDDKKNPRVEIEIWEAA
jgi:Holliday junction resolvase RusA-like endonuclease